MNAVISHATALFYLDRNAREEQPEGFERAPSPCSAADPQTWARSARTLKAFDLGSFARPGKPIDILIPTYSHVHTPKGYAFHGATRELPPGSLCEIGDGILICSAQLAFMQLCCHLPLVRCIKLGCFICGVYSKEPSSPSGVVDRRPLSSIAELEEFVEAACHVWGYWKAKEALRWIHEGAASPMETNLALPFYLPDQLGGYGYTKPTMNFEVPFDSQEQMIAGAEKAYIDVYWPDQRIGFEYTSYAMHGEEKKIGEDERRALVLHRKGIHVELVTKAQVDDPFQMDILARMLEEYGVPRSDSLPESTAPDGTAVN